MSAFGALRLSTTRTVILYPSALHLAIAAWAIVSATSIVRIFVVGSCANAFIERAAIATVSGANFVIVISCPVFYNPLAYDKNVVGGSMLILAVRVTIQAGHEDEVIEPFRRLQEETRREPGCIAYFVQRSRENPRRYLVYEQYKDQAALDAHR